MFVNNYDIFEFFAMSAAQLPAQVMWLIISAHKYFYWLLKTMQLSSDNNVEQEEFSFAPFE